jgi:hypothetical protein
MRLSKPWQCEVCENNICWPADETAKLVELLEECDKEIRKSAGKRPTHATRRRRVARGPSHWSRFTQQFIRCVVVCSSLGISRRTPRRSAETFVD